MSKDVGDENYWKGEVNGQVGLFPHCFVEKEKCRALYDFEAEDEDELPLTKNQVYQEQKKKSLEIKKIPNDLKP